MNPNYISRAIRCGKILSLLILLAITSLPALGQYFSPPSTIRTPYGNVTTPGTYHAAPYYGSTGPAKYKFTIVLKDHPDSVIVVKSAIYSEDGVRYLKFRRGGKKIQLFPTKTMEISRVLADTKKKYVGIPTDTCWLFKAVEGKINCYTTTAEKGYVAITGIQQGDGPIVRLTEGNLEPMINGHAKAMKYFEKRKYIKAIQAFNEQK